MRAGEGGGQGRVELGLWWSWDGEVMEGRGGVWVVRGGEGGVDVVRGGRVELMW